MAEACALGMLLLLLLLLLLPPPPPQCQKALLQQGFGTPRFVSAYCCLLLTTPCK